MERRSRAATTAASTSATSAVATAQPRPDHFHRWRIDEPNGPVSEGVCKVCGVTNQFKNWLAEGDFITNEEHRIAA